MEAKDTKTPIHLAIGQEAIATGISCELDPQDKVYSCHRACSLFGIRIFFKGFVRRNIRKRKWSLRWYGWIDAPI